ncbi:major facilitator superfamily domain-containing protein [Lipomyces oligophaga]|uniref:major facilitator superfamily domain-containing protein n=1 Tax=Lipomyces oligophaga TaxID=45792 RepID=UPI0034CDB4A3
MSIEFHNYEVILTEADKEALNGEDANILNIPKDWPELSEIPSNFHSRTSATRDRQYLDRVATQQSIFDDPVKSEALGLNSLYNGLPPFDVQARWTLREEHRVMRKVNVKVLFLLIISMYSLRLCYRGLSPLAIQFLSVDLDISESYRPVIVVILSIFYYMGLIFSSLLLKKLSCREFPVLLLFAAGLASVAQYWITNIAELLVTQAIIALGSSTAFISSSSCMRSFNTHQELGFITSLCLLTYAFIDLVFSLISYGAIALGKAGDSARWRDVSFIYGVFSCIIAICFHCVLAPSPLKVSSYGVIQKWFTSQELTVIVNRVLRDNPFYDNSQKRAMKPNFKKAMKSMFFSINGVFWLGALVLMAISALLSETLRKQILKGDRLSAKLPSSS